MTGSTRQPPADGRGDPQMTSSTQQPPADGRGDRPVAPTRPYPTYKPSGVPWLGDVPEHWEVRRLGDSVVRCINGTWGDEPDGVNDLPCIRVADFDRVNWKVRTDKLTMRAVTQSERSRRMLHRGDLLLEKSGGGDNQPVGAIVLYDHDVEAVCSNFVGKLEVKEGYQPEYLTYLHATLYALQINKRSIKQTTGIQNIDADSYLSEPIAFPPLAEQRAIVRYLDHADRRIRRYVSAKRKLIGLLEEEKQAIINRAVTRGLDPNVRLKPSGVEWLGDVPEHWDVRRAKFFYDEVDERSTTGAEELMSVSHKTGVTPRKRNVTMFLAESNVGYKLCHPGDIVINTMWAYMAALGVARQNGLVSPSYGVYRPHNHKQMDHTYIDSLLRTEAYRANYTIRSTGITSSRLRLYPESFLDMPLLCPPLEEQNAIVEYIGHVAEATDSAIARARRQIELLEEYRTRLIADVVTGKLDVREAAAQLPEEAGGEEPEAYP